LTIEQILAWADAHREVTGAWPNRDSGPVSGAPCTVSWRTIATALRKGSRGLPGGSSLPGLLAEHRGVKGPLTYERILAWADAHHAAFGVWPLPPSGKVLGGNGENWRALNRRLAEGGRGLPGGLSLARLLAAHRDVPRRRKKAPLSLEQILLWADAHHAAHGRWPDQRSGRVDSMRGETWSGIAFALAHGTRGLPGGTTLARFLRTHRGPAVRKPSRPLSVAQILAWADAHHAATGRWPKVTTGTVTGVPGERWINIGQALIHGRRGLPGGSSLPRLLSRRRGVQNHRGLRKLTMDQILAWAHAHHAAHGCWPTVASGPIPGAPGEDWRKIDAALRYGYRGLLPGESLRELLTGLRGISTGEEFSDFDRR